MNYWATNTQRRLAAAAAAAAFTLTGCGAPAPTLDQVRADASTEMEQLVFAEDYFDARKKIDNSVSIDEINNVLRQARESNETNANVYWTCAQRASGALAGSTFTAVIPAVEKFNEVELHLDRDASAELDVVGTAAMVGQLDVLVGHTWLEDNAGHITGWEANLDELIEQRRLELHEGSERPRHRTTTDCTVPFTLTLTHTDGEVTEHEAGLLVRDPDVLLLYAWNVSFDIASN